jgi:hypothetical protein
MNRLETLSLDLAAELRRATPAKQRAAVLAACDFAISRAGVEEPDAKTMLCQLQAGKEIRPQQRKQIDALVSDLDDEYFHLQEAAEQGQASEQAYLRQFAKARAVAALSFACNEDSYEAATEGIYEAAISVIVEDKSELLAVVEAVLRKK